MFDIHSRDILSSSLRHSLYFAVSPTLASRPHPLTWWVKLMRAHQVKQTIWRYLRGVSRVSKCIVGVSTIGAIKSERNNLSLPLGIQFIKFKVNGKLHLKNCHSKYIYLKRRKASVTVWRSNGRYYGCYRFLLAQVAQKL